MRVRARGLVNLVDGIEHSRESPDHLIIVDPSLKDHIGHHAEYDRAVAQAARTGGIAVTVLAHRRVVRDVAARIPVMPVFRMNLASSTRTAEDPSCPGLRWRRYPFERESFAPGTSTGLFM